MPEINRVLPSGDGLGHALLVSRRMAEIGSLLPLLEYAVDEAICLTDAEIGSVVFWHGDNCWQHVVRRSKEGINLPFANEELSHSILEKTVQSEKPVIIRDAIDDQRFTDSTSIEQLRLRSVLCVPLMTRKVVSGVLYVENRSTISKFSETSASLLELLGNQAAIAIENASNNLGLHQSVASRTAVDALKDSLMSLVTQQLQNPLSELKGYAYIVMSALRDETDGLRNLSSSVLFRLAKTIEAVDHTIDGLALVLKILSGELQHDLVPSNIPCMQLLSEVVDKFADDCLAQQLTIDFIVEPVDLTIRADHHYFTLAISHLIEQALRMIPDGGNIRITANRDQDQVVLTMSDDGFNAQPNEPTELLDHPLDVRHTAYEEMEYHTLGLPIAHSLIRVMDGQMRPRTNKDDAGVRFVVRMPSPAQSKS